MQENRREQSKNGSTGKFTLRSLSLIFLVLYCSSVDIMKQQRRLSEQTFIEGNDHRIDNLGLVATFPEDYLPYAYKKRRSDILMANSHWKYKRKYCWQRYCCSLASTTTVIAAILTVVAFMTALGISVYFGILTTLYTSPVFEMYGQMQILEGDVFEPSLQDANSDTFIKKASIYQNKLRSTYLRSLFQNILHDVKVYAFRGPKLKIFFRLHLDRRKGSQLQGINHLAKTVLIQEIKNNDISIFNDLKIDISTIRFKDVNCVDDCPEEELNGTQPSTPEMQNPNGVISVTPPISNVSIINTEFPITLSVNFTGESKNETFAEDLRTWSNDSSTEKPLHSAKDNSTESDLVIGLAKVVSFLPSHIDQNRIKDENGVRNDWKEEANVIGLLHPFNETTVGITHIPPIFQTSEANSNNDLTGCESSDFRCANDKCVPIESRCNRQFDCADRSDEKNCSCADYLKSLKQIHKLCDGVIDCWDYSDEMSCSWCSGQFLCLGSKQCINNEQVCDGIQHCPSGSDESECIKLSKDEKMISNYTYNKEGYLMVQRKGQWKALCLNNNMIDKGKLNLEHLGRTICNTLTYKNLESVVWSPGEFQDNFYYDLIPPTKKSSVSFRQSQCKDGKVVRIKCGSLECGIKSLSEPLTRRIVGGNSVTRNTWPWQVALYREGQFQCGAVIISNRWLLSAGHCFYHTRTSFWVARMGLLRRGSEIPTPYEEIRRITHIAIHPQYVDKGFINDIAVLKLDASVPFSNHIRPICLPDANDDIVTWQGKSCAVIGWGKLMEVGNAFPDTLQEVHLPVISTEECRKRTVFLPIYQITDNMFCAGYERGGRDACLGDSGGPLMCQKPDGRWTLMGITSNGDGCARVGRPGVYTKVPNYVKWIQSILDGGEIEEIRTNCSTIRCRLGRCLPSIARCDGVLNCWDGEDETNC